MQGGNWSAADRMQVVRRCAPYRLCMGCKSEVGEHPGKVSQALHIGVYVQWKGFPMPVKHKDNLSERHEAVVAAAKAAELAVRREQPGQRACRLNSSIVPGCKAASASTTDLVEYALAKVALEDDFGARLAGRKGSLPADIALGV
jgi:hypothetical protein